MIALSGLLRDAVLDAESREIADLLKIASEELDTIVRSNSAQLSDTEGPISLRSGCPAQDDTLLINCNMFLTSF